MTQEPDFLINETVAPKSTLTNIKAALFSKICGLPYSNIPPRRHDQTPKASQNMEIFALLLSVFASTTAS